MSSNTFGTLFRLTTFGESHGVAMGGVVDGCPAGLKLDLSAIQQLVDLRRPGQSSITSPRNEKDHFEVLSGIMDGVTLGTPIGFIIRNQDAKSSDYDSLRDVYRPGHADHTWDAKYGIRDHRGGGRASARETVCRVVGGAIAMQLLAHFNVKVFAWTSSIGPIHLPADVAHDLEFRYRNEVRTSHDQSAEAMKAHIAKIKAEGDSCGGVISGLIKGLPAGIGEPVFSKLPAELAKAMMGINAAKGFELGSGFGGTLMQGSEHNDPMVLTDVKRNNYSGGTNGGISNGQDITFRVAFKPVSTITKPQMTLDKNGNEIELLHEGRHDPCVVPRAVPIVESMAALVIADQLLQHRTSRI